MQPDKYAPVSSLSRSTHLDTGTYVSQGGYGGLVRDMLPNNTTIELEPFVTQVDLGMVSALYNGFYNSSSTANMATSFSCPTGNCTWPIFSSIATCSACNNVTHLLKRAVIRGTNLGTITMPSTSVEDNWVTYSLPSANITNAEGPQGLTPAYMTAAVKMQRNSTLTFKHLNTIISAISIIKADDSYKEGLALWNQTSVTATECALYFCTNVYESAVINGLLKEQVISSMAERNMNSYKGVIDYLNPVETMEFYDEIYDHPLWDGSAGFPRSDLQLRIPSEEAQRYGLTSEHSTSADQITFNITQNTIGSMMEYIWTEFFRAELIWPYTYTGDMPPVTQALAESENLTATFEKAALSLSNWMRAQGNETDLGGVSEVYVIHIYVNWAYLAAPMATLIAGYAFVLYTMFETRRLRLPAWKTDIIPSILYGLDKNTREMLSTVASVNKNGKADIALLRKMEKDTIVQLVKEDCQPQLRGVKCVDGKTDESMENEIPWYIPESAPGSSDTLDAGSGEPDSWQNRGN